MGMVEQLRQDIRDFKAANNCERVVVLWAASTEIYIPLSDEHMSLAALEKAMKENNTDVISPSMCYAYAAIAEDAPFVMGAPNLCVDTPAMWEFSKQKNVPISGKDFKSGQTLMKTVLAPMFKTRMLGVNGWFSTNILGNRDGEVLDDPDNFKTKEVSKLSVIDTIFEPENIRISTEMFIIKYVSTTILPAKTTKKHGTTSTSSDGWATRWKSR